MVLAINKRVLAFLSIFSISALALATFLLVYRLDTLINIDLYNYGLTEGPWLVDYWKYLRLSLILIDLGILANFIGLIYFSSRKTTEIQPTKTLYVAVGRRFSSGQKVSFALLGVGAVMMVVSIYYSFSILSFISLGLIFWGALFLYVKNDRYVKEQLLEKTSFSSLRNMDDMLAKIGNTIFAGYPPPKFMKEFESDRVIVFIKNTRAKGHEERQNNATKNWVRMDLEPPGSRLTQSFEDILKSSFMRMNLQSFNQSIPKVLVEELEIAQEVRISVDNDTIRIRLENSPFAILCDDTIELKRIHNSIGCPICSAFACALAKTTGKFVTIKSEHPNKKKRIIQTEYLLSDQLTRR